MIGAVQTLISVRSDALNCNSFTYVLPAESLTPLAVGPLLFHTPTMTTSRFPAVMGDGGVTAMLPATPLCAPTCCTYAGTTAATGVTGLDAADSAPVPTAFVAATVNVYVVPFVSPPTTVDVAGGDPLTTVDGCAVDPTYGVTV